MRTFEFKDGKSNKFWNIELKGNEFIVTFGRIGTAGQTQSKSFADAAKAKAAHDKLVAEKTGKGYVETTTGGAKPQAAAKPAEASPLQQSLEKALAENPDDLGAHSAYADYLTEQGNPRGEFIQLQLALENPNLGATERENLQEREKDLLKAYAKDWLGDLGRFLVGKWSGPDKPWNYQFARGWLDTVRLFPYPYAVSRSLAAAPQARLLRRLEITYDMRYHPFDFEKFLEGPTKALTEEEKKNDVNFLEGEGWDSAAPSTVFDSPFLTNLRVFKIGFTDTGKEMGHTTMIPVFEGYDAKLAIQLLEKNPHLEELYLNTNFAGINRLFGHKALGQLRVLQYYFGSNYSAKNPGGTYPLKLLATNTAPKKLTHLRLHPGREATLELDEVDAILTSKNLPALTHLQLHMTTYGDEGCRRIVKSGILTRLKELDIGHGNMTDEGAKILAACPDLKKLESLDVSRNALTKKGIAALKAVGINVTADRQHEPEEEDYLYEVDAE
jgi:uncharacterized protein (TIGR02996 family)